MSTEIVNANNSVVLHTDETEYVELPLFESKDELTKSLTRAFYGDLYIIGRLWIETLKFVLVGGNFDIFPTISADEESKDKDKDKGPPGKPQPISYKDLPLYQESEYVKYKESLETKKQCELKFVQNAIYPKVKEYRNKVQTNIKHAKDEIKCAYEEISTDVAKATEDFKAYMRDPEKKELRQGVVLLSALAGYAFARKKFFYKRVFYTTLGALAGGFLCFPEETDLLVRTTVYNGSRLAMRAYGAFCKRDMSYTTKEPLICRTSSKRELEPPPVSHQCDEKKKKD